MTVKRGEEKKDRKNIIMHPMFTVPLYIMYLPFNIFHFIADAAELKKTVYIRWGRTTCPGNGSESVYNGFAGGSHFETPGGAASMLCLPPDPDWDGGKYDDTFNLLNGLIFGTEYQDTEGRSDGLFGESHYQEDAPCVVCLARRQSVLMIPGKSKCYDGWTFEYSGFLMAGHYNYTGATDYYCVDKDPENVPGGGSNQNGYLLYFVEARCGSLPCPPYVNGREFQCVVCTK